MEAQQLNLNTIANNIANVNTTGFKKQKIEFQDLLYQDARPVGGEAGGGNIVPAGVELGNGARVVSTARIFTQGPLTQTGERLDMAIDGNGFFEIQRPDGSTAYTRDGGFKLDANGQVVTADGHTVLSGFGQVSVNATGVSVAPTGEVTVQTPGGDTTFQIQLTRFNNPSGLRSLGGNLYEETPASGAPATGNPGNDGIGGLRQGFLEMSNVNVVQEMVNMIVAQRAYEINSKSITTSDEMLRNVGQLKR